MTIASETARNDYTGNGAVDTYTYGFKIFADSQLLVTQRDDATPPVETTLVLDTDYTVTGAGDTAGGTIVLTAGNLTTNYLLAIRRNVTLTQETDIRNQGSFFAETHEDEFDLLTMADQQQQIALDRSLTLPETGTGISTELPIPEALKGFRWNAAGTALEAFDGADFSAVSTFGPEFVFSSSNLSLAIPNLQGVAGGTVDVITTTVSPAPASLTNNLTMMIEAAGANATTTPSFNPNGLGAKTIVKGSDAALVPGDIVGVNFRMHLVFDAGLDKWVLLNPGDIPSKIGIRDGVYDFAADTGVADAYLVALDPPVTVYTQGMEFRCLITNANLTTTPTINVNGLAVRTIARADGSALLAGDLPAGYIASFIYDTVSPFFHLQNPALQKNSSLEAGATVQIVHSADGELATGTTASVGDDSIPQNTEGDEYMTLAITPTDASNRLLIEVLAHCASSAATTGLMIVQLHQDAIANALAVADETFTSVANSHQNMKLVHEMPAGTVSATTFKVRIGTDAGGTLTFNGDNGGRFYGGKMASYMRITEIKV